jgi:hypothetical protein
VAGTPPASVQDRCSSRQCTRSSGRLHARLVLLPQSLHVDRRGDKATTAVPLRRRSRRRTAVLACRRRRSDDTDTPRPAEAKSQCRSTRRLRRAWERVDPSHNRCRVPGPAPPTQRDHERHAAQTRHGRDRDRSRSQVRGPSPPEHLDVHTECPLRGAVACRVLSAVKGCARSADLCAASASSMGKGYPGTRVVHRAAHADVPPIARLVGARRCATCPNATRLRLPTWSLEGGPSADHHR